MAKFVAIDAHALNTVFSNSDISFVNPFCKKQADADLSTKKLSFSDHNQHTSKEMLSLSGQCTTVFNLELLSWQINPSEQMTVLDDHLPSKLNYRYLESVSPPPRWA
ncbi:hypothetical protein ES711_09905 [Gelidibacter salicanalis]|uniref:Uncharacterized protein n=1 Tax=Gelidibacter salicanalis TaxID=291193 RepID=A0A5C7AG57_9FLAO|nr:hypothetical protein [Gelidibacter salicanalis]TXE07746.1 hypothetical protein ES711_09905 [Gelidibacter salicanalis]